MKKILLFAVLFVSGVNNAQEFSYEFSSNYKIDLPRFSDYERFYQMEYEMESDLMPNTLLEVEKKKNENKLQQIEYIIRKQSNDEVFVVLKLMGYTYAEATYKNGLLEGKKIIYHGNHQIFRDANYAKGKLNGTTNYYSIDGDLILESNYKNDIKHGKRIYYIKRNSESRVEGEYDNGKLIGDLRISNKYGSVFTIPNDMKKGVVKQYLGNILLAECTIIAPNVIHGEAKIYNQTNGKLIAKIPYIFGKIHGEAEYYNHNGEFLTKLPYKNHHKVGTHKLYSQNKTVTEEINFDDYGLKTGKWIKYNSKGTIVEIRNYKDDFLNGEMIHYDENGTIKYSTNYLNNKPNGISKQYKEGKLEMETNYLNDKTISSKKFYSTGELFSINEKINSVYKYTFYYKNGELIHENIYDNNEKAIEIHKFYDLINDEPTYRSENHHDENGNKIKYIYKTSGGTLENNYRNNVLHGHVILYNETNEILNISYYYESGGKSKQVTKEEFEQLTKSEKK